MLYFFLYLGNTKGEFLKNFYSSLYNTDIILGWIISLTECTSHMIWYDSFSENFWRFFFFYNNDKASWIFLEVGVQAVGVKGSNKLNGKWSIITEGLWKSWKGFWKSIVFVKVSQLLSLVPPSICLMYFVKAQISLTKACSHELQQVVGEGFEG